MIAVMRPSYAQAAKARMRDTILDAAYDLVVARGWTAARMADIAAAVGLSRQTLYNEFGSKDGLAAAVALRETERFLRPPSKQPPSSHSPRSATTLYSRRC
jgi:AcrR family transcriptional regulator